MTVHEDVLQAVSARMDGELDPDRAFLASCHLAECADCDAVAAAFARVDALARAALVPEGPAPFEAAVATALAAGPATAAPAARPGRAAPARRRRSRPPRRLALIGLAALLALVAVVGVTVVIPSTGPGPLPQRVAAAEVLARAERAAAGIRSLAGSFTRTGKNLADESAGTYRFVYAEPDRLRVEGHGGALFRLRIHDGRTGRRVMWLRGDSKATVWKGTPLLRPQDVDALLPLGEGFAWYGARLLDPSATAEPSAGGGAGKVYKLTLEREKTYEEITGPARFTHYEVWVDAETYLPVRVRHVNRRAAGAPVVEETRFNYEQVNGEVRADAFAVPKGARAAGDGTFEPMPLAQARARARYEVPEARMLPGREWKLLRSGLARTGGITGAEGVNPAGHDLVVAVYGHGLGRLTVTSLGVTAADLADGFGGTRPYEDPFGGEGRQRASKPVRLRRGAFAGTVARLGLPPDQPPYLWFRARDGVVVTLSGTVTADQLVAAAESMTR